MNAVLRLKRLSAVTLALALGLAPAASAQTLGTTVASFNILAATAVTLTGFAASPMVVPRVGTAPGTTLTTTNASATEFHGNDVTSINGQEQAQALWDSLTNVAAVTVDVLAANTFPPNLPAAGAYTAGVIKITAAADITDTGSLTITGTPDTIIIIKAGTFVSLTNMDIILAGGITPSNVYWQVATAVTIINNDATVLRTIPGTIINNTAAQDITVTVSGAGALNTGRLLSHQGAVSVTQSAAGALTFTGPAAGPGVFFPGCTDGLFYPSPATGAVGTFSYCMDGPGSVTIKVYNAIGDLVSKIEDSKPKGQHTSTMNTQRLAPGVYLYTLERDYGTHHVRSGVKKFAVKR